MVQVGAFANPQSVIAKLQSAKMPYYTKLVQQTISRACAPARFRPAKLPSKRETS